MPANVGSSNPRNDGMRPRKKLRILYLLKLLYRETDETRGLTASQIIADLHEDGFSIERKTLYDDIAALKDFGIDVHTTRRTHVEYAIHNHRIWE